MHHDTPSSSRERQYNAVTKPVHCHLMHGFQYCSLCSKQHRRVERSSAKSRRAERGEVTPTHTVLHCRPYTPSHTHIQSFMPATHTHPPNIHTSTPPLKAPFTHTHTLPPSLLYS